MNILKPFFTWSSIILLLLFSHNWVYGKEIRVIGTVNPGDAQWNAISKADNAERDVDVILTLSARIIIGDKPLKLFARTLKVKKGSRIVSFKSPASRGRDGQGYGGHGSRGADGKNAGGVSLDVYRLIGDIQIDVQGQAGGQGGNGAQGKRGADGTNEIKRTKERCRDKIIQVDEQYKCNCIKDKVDCNCRNQECNCERSWKRLWKKRCHTCRVCDKCPKTSCETCTRKVPKVIPNGHCWTEPDNISATNGGNGGPGGKAGSGGNGGNANTVTLRVRDHYDANLSVIYRGGTDGKAGQPASGGQGGNPGKRVLLSPAQPGAKGPDGKTAPNGHQGKGGKVQLVSLAHLEKQRNALNGEIKTLNDNLEKTKTRKNELVRTLANKYPWVQVWFDRNFKRPYHFFKPNIHAGPNSDAVFSTLIAGLKISDAERKRLNDVRNDFIRMRMDNQIVTELDDAIKHFEEQLKHCNGKLANALNWKNAQNLPLYGDKNEIKARHIVADNKVLPSSCRVQ